MLINRLLASTPAVLAFLLALSGCNPQTSTVGSELLGGADLYIVDTFGIALRPVAEDSIRTDQSALNGPFVFNLLGELDDPQFGRLTAEVYSRFTLLGSSLTFPADARLEGIELSLYLINHYGQHLEDLQFSVHELAEALPANTPRYVFDTAAWQPTNLAGNFRWRFPRDTAYLAQEVTIPLDPSLGEKLLRAPASVLATPDAFQSFFPGLRVAARRADPSRPGVMYAVDFNEYQRNYTRLRLRYRTAIESDTGRRDTVLAYDFVVPRDLPRFHSLRRSHTTNTLLARTLADSAEADGLVPIQAGLMVKLAGRLQGLEALRNQPVNRALLTLNVDRQYIGSNPRFTPPRVLSIYEALPTNPRRENALLRIATAVLDTNTYSYTFNVTPYVRDLALGNSRAGFVILGNRYAQLRNDRLAGSEDFIQRAVIGGRIHPSLQPRLKVYLTRVEGG
jgi:hypothetical protein